MGKPEWAGTCRFGWRTWCCINSIRGMEMNQHGKDHDMAMIDSLSLNNMRQSNNIFIKCRRGCPAIKIKKPVQYSYSFSA